MEKKTKKLQLRKETIAVLNGERMSHVVGGTGEPTGIYPDPNNPTGYIHDTHQLQCPNGLAFNPAVLQCVPLTIAITTIIIITTIPKPAY